MSSSAKALACRRELLVARCGAQRKALTGEVQSLLKNLAVFDLGLTLFERLKKNPAWIAGLMVGVVAIKPRRLLSVLQTALLAWQAVRVLMPAMKNIVECHPEK
jgi:hypothetical protein